MQFGVSESIGHWGKYRKKATAVYYNGRSISYLELNALIDSLCNAMNQAQFDNERIGIAVKSKLDYLVSIISILRIGKSVVILNIGLPKESIRVNIADTEVSVLIYDRSNTAIKDLFRTSERKKILDINEVLQDAERLTSKFYPNVIRQPNDEWGVVFSSGTTGIPKGIARDHNSVVTELLGWCLELGLNRNDLFYIGRPIYYTGGLMLALSVLIVGGTVFLKDYGDDNDLMEVWADYQSLLEEHMLTWAFFVPDQIRAFIQVAEELKTPPRAARTILVMGAPISGDEKVKARHILQSRIVESWGNSESLGTITDPEDIETRPDSIGRPFLTDEMCIVNKDGLPATANEYGWIAGSQEAGFCEYCNRPPETDRVKRNELIISDDYGYIDQDGYFYVLGRDQDCILIENEIMSITDIEKKVRDVSGINECCIVAKEGERSTFRLIGVVVHSPGVSADKTQLLQQINLLLKPNERLSNILLIKSMPHLPSGKVDKIAIKRLVKDRL